MPEFRITVTGESGPHSWVATYADLKTVEAALRAQGLKGALIEECPAREREEDPTIHPEAVERQVRFRGESLREATARPVQEGDPGLRGDFGRAPDGSSGKARGKNA